MNNKVLPHEILPVNFTELLEEGKYEARVVDVLECDDENVAIKFEVSAVKGSDGKPRLFWSQMKISDVKKYFGV